MSALRMPELITRTKRELNTQINLRNMITMETSELNAKHRLSEADTQRVDQLRDQLAPLDSAIAELTRQLSLYEAEQAEDEEVIRKQSIMHDARTGELINKPATWMPGTGYGPGVPVGGHRSGTRQDGKGFLSLRNARDEIRTAAERAGGYDVRALLAVGSTATGVEILEESPLHLGKPATSLLDLIPARTISGGQYSYLRQTVRTNNAAPVAVGGTKPTSVFTLERVTGTLEVVAHLSEAIHEPWLADVPALDQFVQAEMVDGIGSALEDQILNGTGVSPELDGIIATGTGTQAYATSPIVTIRTAIAQLEAAGQAAAAIVLASADWLAIETATVTGGAFLLGDAATGAPLDRIKRTLWGVPVVVSAEHTAGTAVVIAEESVGLVTNGGVEFIWARINDDFSKNQVRGRAEIRAQVEVYRPSGIIVCDLTA